VSGVKAPRASTAVTGAAQGPLRSWFVTPIPCRIHVHSYNHLSIMFNILAHICKICLPKQLLYGPYTGTLINLAQCPQFGMN
jgi:hypothetical protein